MLCSDRNPDRRAWDEYVTTGNCGIFSHLYGWGEALARTYGLPIFRLAVRDRHPAGRICGILPLLLFAPPGRVARLISLPYTDAAGVLADSPAGLRVLLAEAIAVAREQKAVHLELRQPAGNCPVLPAVFTEAKGYTPHAFKVGLSRTLPAASETLWKDLSAKVRNQVRKARKCGCVAQVGGAELLDHFYQVFSENMRDLGSPVHARKLFPEVMRQLHANARVIVVYVDEDPAAAAMVFRCKDTLYNPWASSLRIYRPKCPNMLLYWTMLEFGCRSGCGVFDFGRSSPGASTCRFKLQWGAAMKPLVWHVVSWGDASWEPTSECLEYGWWKGLSLAESRRSGPALRRWISL